MIGKFDVKQRDDLQCTENMEKEEDPEMQSFAAECQIFAFHWPTRDLSEAPSSS
jgi:hypothetical protein